MIDRLTIVGVGLIGGSLAMALRKAGQVREVVGVGRSLANLKVAHERGIVDRFEHDPVEGCRGADLVFLSVPVDQIAPIAAQIRPALKPGCVVTDGGSTKRVITEETDRVYRLPQGAASAPAEGPAFVAGHPIAGTEKSGAAAAFPELYQGRRVILTPGGATPAWAVNKVQAVWEAAGAVVERMDPGHHDKVLAGISHLPHAAAFALVNAVLRMEQQAGEPILQYAAGGFLDFTRIASSDPAMWRDIFLQNGDEVLRSVQLYENELQAVRRMIEARDAEGLAKYVAEAKAARDGLVRR